jgi:hypothetical protein
MEGYRVKIRKKKLLKRGFQGRYVHKLPDPRRDAKDCNNIQKKIKRKIINQLIGADPSLRSLQWFIS